MNTGLRRKIVWLATGRVFVRMVNASEHARNVKELGYVNTSNCGVRVETAMVHRYAPMIK